jgi:hypothetical protein
MVTIMARMKTQAAPPKRATGVYPFARLEATTKIRAAVSEMTVYVRALHRATRDL